MKDKIKKKQKRNVTNNERKKNEEITVYHNDKLVLVMYSIAQNMSNCSPISDTVTTETHFSIISKHVLGAKHEYALFFSAT